MNENMKYWDALRTPPKEALKEIKGGRLKGMTDISPQWRMKALTEQFGPVGYGWKYEITNERTIEGPDGQVGVFVNINLYVCGVDGWTDPIPGTGGSMLVAKETSGLYFSDEAFKMATTDAISVAAKALGVGADVYMGQLDSKYQRHENQSSQGQKQENPMRQETNQRIYNCLKKFCKTQKEAGDLVEELSSFYDKKTKKQVKGKRDYGALSDPAAEILLTKLQSRKVEPEQEIEKAICGQCGKYLDQDGICNNPDCDIPF